LLDSLLQESRMVDVLERVVELDLLNDAQPSLDLFDIDYLNGRMDSLLTAFPEPFFHHAMAVKANPLRCVMKLALEHQLGAECASLQEAIHAIKIGFPAGRVVYDSPVKTETELRAAVDMGLHTNLDNEQEIKQVSEYLKSFSGPLPVIGLRINPVVGAGNIAMISTATKQSKFGVPLTEDTRDRILELFVSNPWLTGVHIHVGSQGVPMEKFVDGTVVLSGLLSELETACPGQIKTVDIGGGLSTSYTQDEEPENFKYSLYRAQLQEKCPVLFSGKYQVVTEMGRSLFLKAGTSFTRVQTVKDWIPDQNPILLTHLGTNQFPREAYLPQIWRHRFSLFDSQGKVKKAEEMMVDIGGPMCFQGDYLAKEVSLPTPESGDILAIHDTGAYTMSMYCRFNNIRASPVYGFTRDAAGNVTFQCYKQRETVDECLSFWGLEAPVSI